MIAKSVTPNRFILFLLGLLLLASGAGVLALALGLLSFWPAAPNSESAIQDAVAWPAQTPILVFAGCVLVALLALLWLIGAIPRAAKTKTYQLHQDGRRGTTDLNTGVLEQALERRAEQLPGVVSAQVRMAGTGDHPDVLIRAHVNERLNLSETIDALHGPLIQDCELALGVPLTTARIVVDPVLQSKNSRYAQLR